MSDFADSARLQRESGLRCPRCGAQNRPRATYITVEPGARASCMVCAHVDALAAFHPTPGDR